MKRGRHIIESSPFEYLWIIVITFSSKSKTEKRLLRYRQQKTDHVHRIFDFPGQEFLKPIETLFYLVSALMMAHTPQGVN